MAGTEGAERPLERLDVALVVRGLVATRSRARDLIVRGLVTVEGAPVLKPAHAVASTAAISVDSAEAAMVSRGALKLIAALDAFGFDPAGRIVLDVGASTGGFTQTLLERGAARVYAVDVGHGQLHESLRSDARCVSLEGCDARTLSPSLVPEPVEVIVADVSFISLIKAMPAALALAVPGAWLIALVKPQFEVGPALVGKGGIVRDEAVRLAAVDRIARFLAADGCWTIEPPIVSPITGGSGNFEYLIGAVRRG